MMYGIKWMNRFSGEAGYVKDIKTKDKHFVNTWKPAEAKAYKTEAGANKAIDTLNEIGEGENNEFELTRL